MDADPQNLHISTIETETFCLQIDTGKNFAKKILEKQWERLEMPFLHFFPGIIYLKLGGGFDHFACAHRKRLPR